MVWREGGRARGGPLAAPALRCPPPPPPHHPLSPSPSLAAGAPPFPLRSLGARRGGLASPRRLLRADEDEGRPLPARAGGRAPRGADVRAREARAHRAEYYGIVI